MSARCPSNLSAGGQALWRAITAAHELDAMQSVQLEQACRAKDRLDQLDKLLRGDVATWSTLVHGLRTDDYELKIDSALTAENATANLLKQLLAAIRLPDESGKRPQRRGPRGAVAPQIPGGKPAKVSSLERARAAKSS